MTPTNISGLNDCPLGRENKANIMNLQLAVGDIKKSVAELTNHYSQRPSWIVVFVMSGMAAALTGLIVRMFSA